MSAIAKKYLDELTYQVVGAAIEVHKEMGRGLLESVYQQCMKEELNHRKINFHKELRIPICYKGTELNLDFRCDLFVENCLIVELKAVTQIIPQFEAQLYIPEHADPPFRFMLTHPSGMLTHP